MSFRENLKDIMDYRDITIKELAYNVGVPKGSISNYLKENCSIPSADIAVKIAKSLNVTVEYLVTGKNSNFENQNTNFDYSEEVISIAKKLNSLSKEKQKLVHDLVENLEKI